MTVTTLATATAAGWVNESGCAATSSATGYYAMNKMVTPAQEPDGDFTTSAGGSGRTQQKVTESATTQAQLFLQLDAYDVYRAALP